jgi:LacI family transcriptional regulator, gluconate utilization system Gnt-I transcriptional repressor
MRRPTLGDVAHRAGVSPITVSRAFRRPEMVTVGLRAQVDEAVRELGYVPNHLASALASTSTRIVGVIVPSLTNGVFDEYLSAIQVVFESAGIQALVSNVCYSAIEEEKAIQTLLGYRPEAMIVAGIDQTPRSREMLRAARIPVVQTMEIADEPIDMNVGLSHEKAGYVATRYLQDLGYHRIGHITAAGDPRSWRRHTGYARAMAELNVATDHLVTKTARPSSTQQGSSLFVDLLRNAPDVEAVFCCNDDLALGVLFECHRRGIRVPEDLSVMGFNDLEYSAGAFPSLSSVATRRGEIGARAAQMVTDRIRGSGSHTATRSLDVGFRINVRRSTRSPKVSHEQT